MIKDLVTIITPCYNGEKYLSPYIEGLLSQTYSKVQYIFVDDCSTDKTKEIINGYKEKFEAKGWSFTYIYLNENKGQAAAINRGLLVADGEFLSCIDADDILMPTYIEEMSDFLKKNSDCGICFPTTEQVKEGTFEHIKYRKRVINEGDVDNFTENMFLTSRNMPGFPTYMLRMEDFLKYTPSKQIYECRSGQNPQFILPIAYNTKVGYIDKPLIKMVHRESSDSHTDLMTKYYNWEHLYRNVLKFIPNMPDAEKEYLTAIAKNRWERARERLKEKEMLLNAY